MDENRGTIETTLRSPDGERSVTVIVDLDTGEVQAEWDEAVGVDFDHDEEE